MATARHYADRWRQDFEELSGSFSIFSILDTDFRARIDWPELGDYDRLAAACGVVTVDGHPITFIKALPKPRGRVRRLAAAGAPSYEMRVHLGQVPTRLGHWHDFFNVLAWCVFPRAKAALNARQVLGGPGPRTPEQNLLAIFDEGGIVRARGTNGDVEFVFGHALNEAVLREKTGLQGCVVDVEMDAEMVETPLASQLAFVDGVLATRIIAGQLRRSLV